jgi:hypothetical protein
MPTMPSNSPTKRLVKPRAVELPMTAETVVKANTIKAKYSAGPNFSATSITSGASKVTKSVAMVPATKEPMAEVARAGPARPFLAMRLPSRAVAMEADSPGVLRRIVVVEPPYMAP